MKVAVVTDSNAGLAYNLIKQLAITVIPMPFLIDGEEYFEDINLTQQEFYQKLLTDADVSTSQPNIFSVKEVWENLLKTYNEVVYIPMSSGLSGSCDTATNFAKEYNGKVQVVNNRRISITQKESVLDAVKLAQKGLSAKEIKDYLEENSMQASIYIMVNTLKYLKKGGRITPAAAAIGSMLKIKPVLTIQGSKLDKFCQVMSATLGKKRMIEQMIKDITTRFSTQVKNGNLRIMIAHTNNEQKSKEFESEVNAALADLGLKVDYIDPLSLSVSCHIGDGALALACSEYVKD